MPFLHFSWTVSTYTRQSGRGRMRMRIRMRVRMWGGTEEGETRTGATCSHQTYIPGGTEAPDPAPCVGAGPSSSLVVMWSLDFFTFLFFGGRVVGLRGEEPVPWAADSALCRLLTTAGSRNEWISLKQSSQQHETHLTFRRQGEGARHFCPACWAARGALGAGDRPSPDQHNGLRRAPCPCGLHGLDHLSATE